MRVLVIGAGGMLGTDLLEEWSGDDIIPARSRDADIRNAQQVRALIMRVRPDWVVLTAAYTDVDGAEKNPELAFAVNEQGAAHVAQAAREAGTRLLYISTDYLFDGSAASPWEIDAPIAPLNVYGKSKAAGEAAIRTAFDDWCIVRTSWLFGASGPSFPEKILRASETRPQLTVVNDQKGSPTFTRDLARAIRDLVRQEARGTVHATNSGACTWFEFAREILRQAGRSGIPVLPCTTAEAARPARRPANSVLSPTSLLARGIRMRSWQEALGAYLAERRQKGKLAP